MKNKFNGSFEAKCQHESLPVSLLALVAMVLNGPINETVKLISNIPTSYLLFTAADDAQQLGTTLEESRCNYNETQPKRETPLLIYLCDGSHKDLKA